MNLREAQELQETIDFVYVAVYGPLVIGTIIYLIWMKRRKKKNAEKIEDL